VSDSDDTALIDEGNGPSLVVFHGWNGSNHNVLRWLPALVSRFRVIVPDLPGCNAQPTLATAHTANEYAAWAERFMDERGLRTAHLGGLCSGTAIALALASRAPSRVDGLLLHTPFLRPGLIRPAIRLQLALLSSPAGALFGPLRRSTVLATAHRLLFANAAEVEAPQLAHDQQDLLRADVRAGRELARDLLRVDRIETLRAWRKPVGVLLAEHDAFVDAAGTAALVRETAPQARVEIIAGGHGWTPAYVAAQQAALERLAPALI
jgi:pimeloyl-ACP methyl ester carboxylesterase